MLADPEVARYLGPAMDSRDRVATHIERIRARHETDGFGLLAVQRKQDGRVLGRSGFLVWDRRTWQTSSLRDAGEHAEIEIGWTLAHDCWGYGYATEAGRACREHGFAALDAKRIAAIIQHGNERSTAVARRLGMRPEQNIRTDSGFAARLWIATPDVPQAPRDRA
jgi:RimJ/RimL family protein N-acetyltransferase